MAPSVGTVLIMFMFYAFQANGEFNNHVCCQWDGLFSMHKFIFVFQIASTGKLAIRNQ